MFHRKRGRALSLVPIILIILASSGCSSRLEEEDATQLALDEVKQQYSDIDQIESKVISAERRADSGLTLEILARPAEGNVRPVMHEIDVTPDGTVVSHTVNGKDVLSDEEAEN